MIFYLDETNGDDANDGLSLETAVKTHERLNALVREDKGQVADWLVWFEDGEWKGKEVQE